MVDDPDLEKLAHAELVISGLRVLLDCVDCLENIRKLLDVPPHKGVAVDLGDQAAPEDLDERKAVHGFSGNLVRNEEIDRPKRRAS